MASVSAVTPSSNSKRKAKKARLSRLVCQEIGNCSSGNSSGATTIIVNDQDDGKAGPSCAAMEGLMNHVDDRLLQRAGEAARNFVDLSETSGSDMTCLRRSKRKAKAAATVDSEAIEVADNKHENEGAKDVKESQRQNPHAEHVKQLTSEDLQLESTLKDMFPNASKQLLSFCVDTFRMEDSLEMKLQGCINMMLGYLESSSASGLETKKDNGDKASNSSAQNLANTEQVGGTVVDVDHYHSCLNKLSVKFSRASMKSISSALAFHGGDLGETYKCLHFEYFKALAKEAGFATGEKASEGVQNKWLSRGRLILSIKARNNPTTELTSLGTRFEEEWESVKVKFCEGYFEKTNRSVHIFDVSITPEEQMIECGCCCSDHLFEEMVQCANGHLFCCSCVRRRLEESIFGAYRFSPHVQCMDTDGCEESFPWTELQRCIPQDVFLKYEQLQAEDAVKMARLEGLVYCPFCHFPCDVDRDISILKCPNASCKKDSCILCKEASHWPMKCEEVVKDSETKLRKAVEEEMTKALLRQCSDCKASLVKTDGCNKITCRCGQIMCYVCRAPIRDYSHFCQHPRSPKSHCTKCKGCFLWEEQASTKMVKAAKKSAMEKAAKTQPEFVMRKVGPPDYLLIT